MLNKGFTGHINMAQSYPDHIAGHPEEIFIMLVDTIIFRMQVSPKDVVCFQSKNTAGHTSMPAWHSPYSRRSICCMYRMAAKHANNHVFDQCLEARSFWKKTTACKKMMSLC